MTGKPITRTRSDLVDAIYWEVGLSLSESAELLDSVLQKISDSLVEDGTVKISSFGTFAVRSKRERIGRNPKTGETHMISARQVLTFRASAQIKKRVSRVQDPLGKPE